MVRTQAEADAPIRLLIVDDHAALRQGLAGVFATMDDVFVVGEADSGQGAIALARSLNPNAILMDINMKDMSGVEATRTLKREHPRLAVVGLSIRDDETIRSEMLGAGAYCHLSKEASIEEIVEELRKAVGVE
jgi:DNA-binding NarL/FixJ family response regulator